jgi:hypothetical protein
MSVDENAFCDRLYADALSAGLRSSAAFYRARVRVAWEDIETYVRDRATAHTTDLSATPAEAERALEDTYTRWREIGSGDGPLQQINLLTRAARKLLQPDGREMILRVDREKPGREILRWRFVSLALPQGILIAAATERGFVAPKGVRILNPSISPDRPVAQNHLHHAAMTSFEDLWALLRLRALTEIGAFTRSIQAPRAFCPGLHRGVCPTGRTRTGNPLVRQDRFTRAKHMAEWADMILQAFIARRVLDRHTSHGDLLATCSDPVCETGRMTLRAFLAGQTKPYSAGGTAYPWPEESMHLARCYRKAIAEVALRRVPSIRTALVRQQTADEGGLLVRAFAHLGREVVPDPGYETLFLQYLRVKTAVFGLLVHPPGEHGLEKFLEHFNQIKVYAPESDTLRPPKPNEPGLNVLATEYRVAPDAWLRTLLRDNEIEEGVPDEGARSEAAWLIHFKRQGADKKLPCYIEGIRRMEGEAASIAAALDQEPTRLRRLRGLDVCGVEGWQPLWVSAQTLRGLRLRSRRTAARRPGLGLEPLRLTVHAGEDFRWLTSGMRAVAEPFLWNLIERGDRIGHGIAITLNPADWWKRHEGEIMPVKTFDRLLDLAFLAEYALARSPEQSEWLRLEIEKVAKALWPKHQDKPPTDFINTAREVWRQLGGRLTRRLIANPPWMSDKNAGQEHEEWIYRYLWYRSTQERADKPIQMKVDDDGNDARTSSNRNERDLLIKAQAQLIREVARWQVCIESNPSSNLVVGSLDAMASQDFLQRRPTHPASFGSETLTWTISTDDPITFSTTLADEYAYAWAGMVLRKNNPYDPSYARALLDEAAETSMRMRFTLPQEDRERINPEKGWRKKRARRD